MKKIIFVCGILVLLVGGGYYANSVVNNGAEKKLEAALSKNGFTSAKLECSVLIQNSCTIENLDLGKLSIGKLTLNGIRDYQKVIEKKEGSFSYGAVLNGVTTKDGKSLLGTMIGNSKLMKNLPKDTISILKTNAPKIKIDVKNDFTKEKTIADIRYGISVNKFPLKLFGEIAFTYKNNIKLTEELIRANPFAIINKLSQINLNKVSVRIKHSDGLLMNILYHSLYLSTVNRRHLSKNQYIRLHKQLFHTNKVIENKLTLGDFTNLVEESVHGKSSILKQIRSAARITPLTDQQVNKIVKELIAKKGDLTISLVSKNGITISNIINNLPSPDSLFNKIKIEVN